VGKTSPMVPNRAGFAPMFEQFSPLQNGSSRLSVRISQVSENGIVSAYVSLLAASK